MSQDTNLGSTERATAGADTVKETYKDVAVNDSFNQIINFEDTTALATNATITISDKLNRKLSNVVRVNLKVGRKAADGQVYFNKYDSVELPTNLVAADFDKLKNAYLATVKDIDDRVKATCDKRKILDAISAEERKALFNKLFNGDQE